MDNVTEIAGCLIVEDGKLLLLFRKDKEWWEVPGGKVEDGESPTEAAVREVDEEIDVSPELRKPFYSGEFEHDGEMFLWHGYLASLKKEPEIQEEKFGRLEWFEGSELDELELAPNLRQILPGLRKLS